MYAGIPTPTAGPSQSKHEIWPNIWPQRHPTVYLFRFLLSLTICSIVSTDIPQKTHSIDPQCSFSPLSERLHARLNLQVSLSNKSLRDFSPRRWSLVLLDLNQLPHWASWLVPLPLLPSMPTPRFSMRLLILELSTQEDWSPTSSHWIQPPHQTPLLPPDSVVSCSIDNFVTVHWLVCLPVSWLESCPASWGSSRCPLFYSFRYVMINAFSYHHPLITNTKTVPSDPRNHLCSMDKNCQSWFWPYQCEGAILGGSKFQDQFRLDLYYCRLQHLSSDQQTSMGEPRHIHTTHQNYHILWFLSVRFCYSTNW